MLKCTEEEKNISSQEKGRLQPGMEYLDRSSKIFKTVARRQTHAGNAPIN